MSHNSKAFTLYMERSRVRQNLRFYDGERGRITSIWLILSLVLQSTERLQHAFGGGNDSLKHPASPSQNTTLRCCCSGRVTFKSPTVASRALIRFERPVSSAVLQLAKPLRADQTPTKKLSQLGLQARGT